MNEISAGKDSMDGHWEMMGLPVMKHYQLSRMVFQLG